jgi:hypothetical protein
MASDAYIQNLTQQDEIVTLSSTKEALPIEALGLVMITHGEE